MFHGSAPISHLRESWRILLKEISAFGVVGGINFVLDVAIYQWMYAGLNQGALFSKVVSTAVTATTAYFMHRHWSFSHRARSGFRREYTVFFALSVVSLLAGLALIGFVRYGLDRTDVLALQIANVASIMLGAAFRFWAYKKWVFLAPDTALPAAAPVPASSPGPTAVASPAALGPATTERAR